MKEQNRFLLEKFTLKPFIETEITMRFLTRITTTTRVISIEHLIAAYRARSLFE